MGLKKKTKKLLSRRDSVSIERFCLDRVAMKPGNRLRVLRGGGEAYPEMIETIEAAERSVLMESYIFNSDRAGLMFAEALLAAAWRGVSVNLIVDGFGTLGVPSSFFAKMADAGVEILVYRSMAPWRRSFGLSRRNHRKLLVVDGRVGFTGGMNIGDEWLPQDQGGKGWHDIHVRIEGPAVRDMASLSAATWHNQTGRVLDARVHLPEVPESGDAVVGVIGSRERKKRRAIRHTYLHAIKRARRYIYIANAYFLPDAGFRRALRNAVKRGVDVRVMVPRSGDVWPVQLASQALFSRLLRAGVRIFALDRAVLHAKTAAVDDRWATVGSFNIDHRSLTFNLEANVATVDHGCVVALRRGFEADMEGCIELTYEGWMKRPWILRILERIAYQFRHWM